MDALRRFRLESTFDGFVHSIIVDSEMAAVQTAVRRRLPARMNPSNNS
jgi:hypothetical protein